MDIKQNSDRPNNTTSADQIKFTNLPTFSETAKLVEPFDGSYCRLDNIRMRHITQRDRQNDLRGSKRCNLYATAGYNRRIQDRRNGP